MVRRYRRGAPQTRQLLGTLLVAWSLVAGCAATLGSAIYANTQDIKVLIAWFGAPFLVGTVLLLLVAFAGLSTRVKEEIAPEPDPTGMRVRNDIHGLKKRVR